MNATKALHSAFVSWGLPQDAVVFLLKVWESIQFLDDVKDGDAIENVDGGIFTLLIGLPTDSFLAAHREILAGALLTMYFKWQAANVVEAAKDRAQLDKSYMWRAGYYDVVMLVVALCLPRVDAEELAAQVMALYGETRKGYVKEIVSA